MKNVKVKTKLILGFIVPIILSILNVYLGMSSTRSVVKVVEGMYETEEAEVAQLLEQIGADGEKSATLLDTMEELKISSLGQVNTRVNNSNIFSVALIVVSVIITIIIALSINRSFRCAALRSRAEDSTRSRGYRTCKTWKRRVWRVGG